MDRGRSAGKGDGPGFGLVRTGILTGVPERMSVFDLAELAADVGPNPRNVGVLLELDGPAPQVQDS